MAFLELGSPSKIPREAVLAQIPKTIPHKEHIKQLCEHLESLCYGALSGPTIQAKQQSRPSGQARGLLPLPTPSAPVADTLNSG